MPRPDERRFLRDGRGVTRSRDAVSKAHDQACRERWRQLVLLVKAKLEAIALGLSTVEREFLADVYLPDGRTVHQALQDGLVEMYKSGTLPPMLGPAR